MKNKTLGIVAILIFIFSVILVYLANPNSNNQSYNVHNNTENEAQIITENNTISEIKGLITITNEQLEEAKHQEYLTSKKIQELQEKLQKENERVKIISKDLELLFCRESVESLDLSDPTTQEYWTKQMHTYCHDKEMIPLALRNDDVMTVSYNSNWESHIDEYEPQPIFSDEEMEAIMNSTIYDDDYLYHVSDQ